MIDDILLQVRRPARYIGQEWNMSRKPFDKARIKFAICFPDFYEVGMSNLGLRIIYALANHIEDVVCERFFSPDIDMEQLLRANNMRISSLESHRSADEFDMFGFSLGYELTYTNVLNLLELSGIPLESSKRDKTHPLVIGGGPCTLNPEPLHEFFDLFVIGEAEEVIFEIIDTYRKFQDKFKSGMISRQDLLISLSAVEGVYVPSLYEVQYDSEGRVEKFAPKMESLPVKIKKRFVKNLNSLSSPLDWLIPYIPIVHDRLNLEIMRGCPNRCRFCQARVQYWPFRKREKDQILKLAAELYKRTGYEEITLGGLSVSDYSGIEDILKELMDLFKEKCVAVALPSIKPKTMVGNISSLLATVKKAALTFAPEAGSEKLRSLLGKDFNLEDFFKAVEQAYLCGYQHLKLYFMIGIPFEEEEDLDAIVNLANEVSILRRKLNKGPAQVNLSINALIPKPHTAFQWFKMQGLEEIRLKQAYLNKKVKSRKLKLTFHNRQLSFLEGVLSRGDRKLSGVIFNAFKSGAKFDLENTGLFFDKWMQAFSQANINPDFYLRQRSLDEILPWDFLDTGITKEELAAEERKLIAIK